MKTTRVVRRPCVRVPAQPWRPEEHVLHGSVGAARRNATLMWRMGAEYHSHEVVVPTVWGLVLRLLRRIRRAAFALVCIVAAPVALPLLGAAVAAQTWARALGWIPRRPRYATWYWRVWWFYGCRLGLYRLDWRMKARAARRGE